MGERLQASRLAGAVIEHAVVEDDFLGMALRLPDGSLIDAVVMADPEGNGPGALHLVEADSRARHILGGR